MAAGPACVYDSDDRCGSDRTLSDAGLCVCKQGTVDEDGECVPEPTTPAGLGDACDAETPCEGTTFTTCRIVADGEGYCTESGCTSDDDCEGDFYCVTEDEESYCKRPPTGVGEACTSNDDCSAFEASFCLTANPMGPVCVIADCTAQPNSCPPGDECQDFSEFLPGIPLICAPPL